MLPVRSRVRLSVLFAFALSPVIELYKFQETHAVTDGRPTEYLEKLESTTLINPLTLCHDLGPLSLDFYLCMRVRTCIFMHTCIHVCLHVCLHVCFTCVYMCVYMCDDCVQSLMQVPMQTPQMPMQMPHPQVHLHMNTA